MNDKSKNGITRWIDERWPDASPFWRIVTSGIFISLAPLAFWQPDSLKDTFETFGTFWGALIGLGGLVIVTRQNHQQDAVRETREANLSSYLKAQAITAWLVRAEQAVTNLPKQFTHLAAEREGVDTDQFSMLAGMAMYAHLPTVEEWIAAERLWEGLPADIQLGLSGLKNHFCNLRMTADYLAKHKATVTIKPDRLMQVLDPLEPAQMCIDRVRPKLKEYTHSIADSLGVKVSIVEREGTKWSVQSVEPDPSLFSYQPRYD